jgi:AcrR family transcriptional regulator
VKAGRRAQNKLQTHRALQSAARQLVAERGLSSVTIDEIATTAKVSKRTFFNYFDSKEGAIVDAPPGAPAMMAAILDSRPSTESPLESLRMTYLEMYRHMVPQLQDLVRLMRANPELAARHVASYAPFREVIIEWAERRCRVDAEANVYPELLAIVGGAAIQLVWRRWQPEEGQRALTHLVNEIFDVFVAGFSGV